MRFTIGDILVDAALSEVHSLSADVTTYPVEGAGDYSDHVNVKPFMLSVQGVITDTPLGEMVNKRASEVAGNLSISQFNYNKMERLLASKQQVTVSTSLRDYKSMQLTQLEITRDAATGAALGFSCELQQLQIVTSERAIVRVAEPRLGKKANRGFKQKGNAIMRRTTDGVTVYDLGPKAKPRLVLADNTAFDSEFTDLSKLEKDESGQIAGEPVVLKKTGDGYIRLDQRVNGKTVTPLRPKWSP